MTQPIRALLAPSLLLLASAACARMQTAAGASAPVTAELRAADGRALGTARFEEMVGGTRLTVRLTGVRPGAHGLHIHDVGRCDAPAFTSAGPHWNPDGRQHGTANPRGPHRGDLPSVVADARGEVNEVFEMAGIRLAAEAARALDADGASIVLHERSDDLVTDPSGNSGDRIACGVLRR